MFAVAGGGGGGGEPPAGAAELFVTSDFVLFFASGFEGLGVLLLAEGSAGLDRLNPLNLFCVHVWRSS